MSCTLVDYFDLDVFILITIYSLQFLGFLVFVKRLRSKKRININAFKCDNRISTCRNDSQKEPISVNFE